MRILVILTLILRFSENACAITLEKDCVSSLQSLFAEKISKEEAGEFLKLQGDITLHRLAWAYLHAQKKDKDEKIQSVERTIIELLNDKYTNTDPNFLKARQAFEAQPLSRTTLAEIAPYLKEILSNDYEDKDAKFLLNNSDLKLLAAIAKQEKSSIENGIYSHKMLSSHSANGMLNFVKLINSSYKISLDVDEENLKIEMKLDGLENTMASMQERLSNFLNKIELPSSCQDEISCNAENMMSVFFQINTDVQDIFWESLSDKLLSDDLLLEKLSYGDLWLKTNGSKVPLEIPVPSSIPEKPVTVKKVVSKKYPSTAKVISSTSQRIGGLIVDDPLRIIVNDKAGRSAENWKKFGQDYKEAMAGAIIAGEKVFFYNGQLHNREDGKFISVENAIKKIGDKDKAILRRTLGRIGITNRITPSVVEAWVNGKETFVFEGKLYNRYGTEIDPIKVVIGEVDKKLGLTLSSEALRKLGNDYVVKRANALRNNQPYFKHGNQTLDAYSGRNVSSPFRNLSITDIKLEKARRRSYEKLSDSEVIKNFRREHIDKTCGHYGIIDKKQANLTIYTNAGSPVYASEILIGAEASDQRTRWTEYSDRKRVSNSSTGAGIFSVRPQNMNDSFNKRNFNNNILSFKNEDQEDAVFAIHQVPVGLEARNLKFGTNDPADRRISGGCANLRLGDFNAIKKWLGNSCKLYVLPEEEGNKFVIKDNELKLISTQMVDMNKYKFYNFSSNNSKPSKIDIKIVDPRGNTKVAQEFVKTLEDEKKNLMSLYKLSNDEYNELAVLAYGILGNESEFGESIRLKLKENNQSLVIAFKTYYQGRDPADAANTSRGYTQIKNLPDGKFTEFYPEINKSLLNSPRNSAIATIGYLVETARWMRGIANQNKSDPAKLRITKENMIDFMGYLYQGNSKAVRTSNKSDQATPEFNSYYKKLQKNMSYIEVVQKFE